MCHFNACVHTVTRHSPLKACHYNKDNNINSVQTEDDSNKREGHCTVTVNDKTLKLEVDTGAKCNVMSLDTHKLMRLTEKLHKPHRQVGGALIKPIGAGEQQYDLQFQALSESVQSILGLQDSLSVKLVTFSKEGTPQRRCSGSNSVRESG